MTVRQSRATLDGGRANSRQGQQAGDADYLNSIGPPASYQPTPTRLQIARQAVSDARRAQLAGREGVETLVLHKLGNTWGCHCPQCGRVFKASQRHHARSKTIDHMVKEHR